MQTRLRVAGLFAGIGGIELGLHHGGHRTELLCEVEPAARRVLRARFPDIETTKDIRELPALPEVDLVAAGFPCQDLSQAGKTAGIRGSRSGLVDEVFRLLDHADPTWLLLENVPFMLALDRGRGMRHLVDALEDRGFTWAYRVVDALAFGLPQRRRRVLLLASRREDPRGVLFAQDAGEPTRPARPGVACGFFWTEGERGLGWAVDAVPTLKGGSAVGIPSPPAIWIPADGSIITPDIRDAERLQGFRAGWTAPAMTSGSKRGVRWKLVGNAVSVPVSRWLGEQLADPGTHDGRSDMVLSGTAWPPAAWGHGGKAHRVDVSMWPVRGRRRHLLEFLKYPTTPLSARAAEGFLRRAEMGNLRFTPGFLEDVAAHAERLRTAVA